MGDERVGRYAAGYMWGTLGVVYNPEVVKDEDANHWNMFTNKAYRKRITIKDSIRDSFFGALGILNEKELKELEALAPKTEEAPSDLEPLKELTKYDNFAALDLRAVKVLECEKVPKSDKLLKFKVDDGFGERQVLSGIAKYYKPEELIGKTLAMIVNLEPRKMMGFESNGMILSVKHGDGYRVIEFPDSVKPGSDIS
jgi:methionine--tRNA ligase beta chain